MGLDSNLKMITALLATSALLAGCGKSSDSGKGDNPEARVSGTYEFTDNGCATGKQSYSSLQEHCQKLIDEQLNKGCAAEQRMTAFSLLCQGQSPGASTPVPATPATPIAPPPAPVDPTCYKPENLTPKGPEIPFDTFIDGREGYYRMTAMTALIQYTEGTKVGSFDIAVTAATDESLDNPQTSSLISCKDVSRSPDSYFTGTLNEPVVIKRESGTLKVTMRSNFEVHGLQSSYDDKLETGVSSNLEAPTLLGLQQKLAQSGQQLHIYQINPVTFQVVISGQHKNGDQAFDEIVSTTYVYKAAPAESSPTPAPAPAPAPAPTDPTSEDAIANICNGYSDTDYKVSCLLKFKHANVPSNIISVCDKYSDTDYKVDCLLKFKQARILNALVPVCTQYSDVDYQVDCLRKFVGLNIAEGAIATCKQYPDVDYQVDCLLKFKP